MKCKASKMVRVVEKGSGRMVRKVVEICGLEAEAGSDLCPRHKFLAGVKLEAETAMDREAHLQRNVKQAGAGLPGSRAELLRRGYQFTANNTCRGCGAAIEWWRTPNQHNAPYDPMPDANSHAVSHYATCSRAGQFRRAS